MEEVGVGAGDQVLETVGGFGFGEADRDRVLRVDCCQCCGDRLEACPGFACAEVGHRADKLVAAVAHDHVVRADVGAKGLADEPQQRVAGQMALTVVDLFETIDVDEANLMRW